MFCPKCGMRALDGATFCQKCGAKLTVSDAVQQAPTAMPAQQTQPQTQNAPSDTQKKKKLRKLPIIFGVIALLIVAVVFVALNWEGKTDYEATVRAYTPYANSQGLPYTCGEVFDKYITNAKWEIRKSGDVAYVDISGTAKGTEEELLVTIQVEAADDRASINPVLVKVGGKETSTSKETEMVFFAFFVAFDEKYDDLSNFVELLNELETTLQGQGNLLETYINEKEGFSFKYPSDWAVMEGKELYDNTLDDTAVVSIYAPEGFGSASNVLVNKTQADYTLFDYTKADFEKEFSPLFDEVSVTDLSNVNIDGVPAIELGLAINTDAGPLIVVRYYYIVGNYTYIISGAIHPSDRDSDGLMIDAIMESYTISTVGASNELETSNTTYFVDQSSETYQPTLILYPDGKFTLLANLYSGVGTIHGTYDWDDNGHTFNVVTRDFSGAIGDDVNNFYMKADGDSLIYASTQQIGVTRDGARFSMSNDIPESMKEFANSSSVEKYNDASATSTSEISTRDFVGTYSYDASFENPDGQYVNFYYLLEIDWDGSDLVVTQTWRGNYIFDHVWVSPSGLNGNTLAFDAITNDSTEPQTHSLTYILAKDSPLGKDTIYIDGDDTMPFVRE